MLCSISTLKCCFHHISVLSSVAHCGMEDTNVINNPVSFPLQKKGNGLPFCRHDHSDWATCGGNLFELMNILLLHPRAIKTWPSLSAMWQAVDTHHFFKKRSGAHQARTSKINMEFMDWIRFCIAVPLLLPLSSSIAWSHCKSTSATGPSLMH